MKILVACEFSQIVTRAFREKGHEAYSNDLIVTEGNPNWHLLGDVRNYLDSKWDMVLAFPPCTHLAVSGARWFKGKEKEQQKAIEFFMMFVEYDCKYKVIENPIGIMSTVYRKPDQIIQPYMFGDPETKATCLWLFNLSKLIPTNQVLPMFHSVHREPPSVNRWKNRSRTFKGIAKAMANQWGLTVEDR